MKSLFPISSFRHKYMPCTLGVERFFFKALVESPCMTANAHILMCEEFPAF